MNISGYVKDMTGKKCGRLLVKKLAYIKSYSNKCKVAYWNCICDCGKERAFDGRSLRNGATKSCGCLCKEINSKRLKGISFTKEHRDKIGNAHRGKKHSEYQRRKNSESKLGLFVGENNPNWRGGIARKPYSFNFVSELRELIRKRDNYQCKVCGKKEINLIEYHRKLPVHHIDYDKTNDNPNNLITLCHSCHSKTGFNRESWQSYFGNLMEDKNYISILC